ncbi:hypothetical protein B0H10DRAFT_2426988, partial [Mycena sp. CBHHK59/15]
MQRGKRLVRSATASCLRRTGVGGAPRGCFEFPLGVVVSVPVRRRGQASSSRRLKSAPERNPHAEHSISCAQQSSAMDGDSHLQGAGAAPAVDVVSDVLGECFQSDTQHRVVESAVCWHRGGTTTLVADDGIWFPTNLTETVGVDALNQSTSYTRSKSLSGSRQCIQPIHLLASMEDSPSGPSSLLTSSDPGVVNITA